MKTAYVCGPLTELNPSDMHLVKDFYARIADVFEEQTGLRAFVPHEHFDPLKHANFTPQQVDQAERDYVCNKTSILVVVAIAPSWGGGIEVEMAHRHSVPVPILRPNNKKISRLLMGNPAVKRIIEYDSFDEAIMRLREWIRFLIICREWGLP